MTAAAPRRAFFRKSLVVPTEHGAWSWLLVPWLVGAAVGLAAPAAAPLAGLALLLTLVGGLSAYMIRQPATATLRIRQGRGRKADQPLALGWAVGFSLLALLCLLGLLLLGRTALLGLAIPFLAILLAYLLAARSGRAAMRSLSMELAGAAGLALTAPAAYIAASGELTPVALALWALLALQNAMGVLYVRQRLADSKQRTANRSLTLWGHVAAFAIVLASGALGWTPLLTAVPFAGFLVRALWAVRQPRPVPDIKRFGFTEVAVELLGGALIAVGYLL
ncbi:MAG TPA: YwiC-like family protein [Anaerolineae bacterium]|nr:YwiC-like family protein [Anaerolineae bacterium]